MGSDDEIALLLSKVALGDQPAFRRLYDRTSAKLFGVCLRILKDRNEAEAVLQEAYINVWNKAGQFNPSKASAIAWLAAIARNRAIDVVRRRKPSGPDIDDALDIADPDVSPEQALVNKTEHQRVVDCLGELKQEHAQIVANTYLNGWSYAQCAEQADVPLGTVKTWIRRSLLALRDCLKR